MSPIPPLLILAALAVYAIWPRRKPVRKQSGPHYLEEETRRAIHTECYGDWPYVPEDRSRGTLK